MLLSVCSSANPERKYLRDLDLLWADLRGREVGLRLILPRVKASRRVFRSTTMPAAGSPIAAIPLT